MIPQLLTHFLVITNLFLFPSSNRFLQDHSTYNEVIAGMKSQKNQLGDLEYNYRVGRSLHFAIVGPGKSNSSIYFYAASFEGDYFAVVNISDKCVIVRPGQSAPSSKRVDIAFVSTQSGKVYRTLEECRTGK